MNNILNKAVEVYGDKQILQSIEEMAELTQALSKYVRNKGTEKEVKTLDNITEEIADVEIMLEQIKILLDIKSKDIGFYKIRKINRLSERMNNLSEEG